MPKAEQGKQTGRCTADLYISTTGIIPNSDFIPSKFLLAAGWVQADSHFHVHGRAKRDHEPRPIFTLGDLTTYSQCRATRINEQVKIAAANIKVDILGDGKKPMCPPGTSVMMVVPVGSASGTGQLFFGPVPWGWPVAFVKGKDYFVSKAATILHGTSTGVRELWLMNMDVQFLVLLS